jgi:hypothetical protein
VPLLPRITNLHVALWSVRGDTLSLQAIHTPTGEIPISAEAFREWAASSFFFFEKNRCLNLQNVNTSKNLRGQPLLSYCRDPI